MTTPFEKTFAIDPPQGTPRSALPWIDPIRKQALAQFRMSGLPTTRQEAWRYTPLDQLSQQVFTPSPDKPHHQADLSHFFPFLTERAQLLIFENGYLHAASNGSLPPTLVNFSSVSAANTPSLKTHLTQQAVHSQDPFVALNTAWFQDGACVVIPKGTTLPDPIYLIYLSQENGAAPATHPRNLIVAEPGSQATVVEVYAGTGHYFTNSVTEAVVADNAILHHIKVETESPSAFHMATLHATVGKDGHFTSQQFALGKGFVRSNVQATLSKPGSHTTLDGLYLGTGNRLVDHHTEIDHVAPHASSQELYKGILADQAKGVFNGKIVVHPHAQKTTAKQINKNLLLSKDVQINTKPLLEIFADDVKCHHGATIGRLNPDELFYLTARGIASKQAKAMLTFAFGQEVIQGIPHMPLTAWLTQQLQERLTP